MCKSYDNFSCFYDELISDVDYALLCSRMLENCKEFSHKPKLVLDAGCGTGNYTAELEKNGLDIIAVDRSPEMLSVASNKLGQNCRLVCQDLCELDLYGTVDTVFCTLDTLNHIVDYDEFKKAVAKMSLFLEKDGLMLFDVNTVYKHNNVLADNIFTDETDNIYLVWQNTLYDDNIVNINLDFFVKQNDNRYNRLSENFDERAYNEQEILNALSEAGLEILKTEDFYTGEKPDDFSEKIIYTVRKVK